MSIVEEAHARLERAIEEYETALHWETKMRLRSIQKDHFARHEVQILASIYRTGCEVRVNGRSARVLWQDRNWSETQKGLRRLTEVEDYYDEMSEHGQYQIDDITLEALR
jgi:hypothetical protein